MPSFGVKALLRSVVAAPKNSYYDPSLGLEFDLSYINDQVIVCSGPVNSYLKSFYRSTVEDLVSFLNHNHGANWHVWNFRGEEPGYKDSDLLNRVSHYPFPDHQAPTLEIMESSVLEIDQFLKQSKMNVAVLHCKAGKGRSGTICCCYLMYKSSQLGLPYDVEGVTAEFTKKRMKRFAGDGISIVSQRRYLDYWYEFLNLSEDKKQRYINDKWASIPKIQGIRIRNGPPGEDVYKLKPVIQTYVKPTDARNGVVIKTLYEFTPNNTEVSVDGDYTLLTPTVSLELKPETRDIRIGIITWCYSWFDIRFETREEGCEDEGYKGKITIKWEELDGFKGTSQKGIRLFDDMEVLWNVESNTKSVEEI
ncbi:protein tyrosine phosphatase [Scheffersomyces xylosifermentans]|uniref:protein tyrosine phosphatase n=1 Tax=Scheffersomyces xylosifermentans TaxID=1304137 RepID=UPI00315D9093